MNKGKRLWPYLIVAAVCLAVTNVYAIFGHGVRSDAMDYMFLYPLFGGIVLKALSVFMNGDYRHGLKRMGFNLYNSGLAAITCGSFLKGVVEIAGTDSSYIAGFYIAGGVMLGCGVVAVCCKY
jgi:hypothetical protein